MSSTTQGPLSDVTVIDLGHIYNGPYATFLIIMLLCALVLSLKLNWISVINVLETSPWTRLGGCRSRRRSRISSCSTNKSKRVYKTGSMQFYFKIDNNKHL